MKSKMSPYNQMTPNRNVIFCDTTMREGEQAPGVCFSLQEKMTLARMLDNAGVHQIQFFPGSTEESRNVVRQLAALDLRTNLVINSVCFENWKKNIDFSLSCGTKIAHLSYFSTPQSAFSWKDGTSDEILGIIEESIRYVKSASDIPIETAFIDATRADETFLFQQIETALAAGSDRICIPDTVGVASPDAITYLTGKTVSLASPCGSIVGIHAHNDFGLALANAIAGFKAGATLIDVSVNGLGDRAGNVSLSEMAVALEAIFGVNTGIDLKALNSIAQYVSEISGRPIPVNQPLVGAHVFSNQDDYHVAAQSLDPYGYRGILADEIGSEERIFFGKVTGPHVVKLMSEKSGRYIPETEYEDICARLYCMAEAHRGQALDEQAFWQAVDAVEDAGIK